MNIVERKTRYSFVYKLPDKKISSVMNAFNYFRKLFGENFDKVFRTITTDNGSEFSSLAELEKISKILVYFAHPYSLWEKQDFSKCSTYSCNSPKNFLQKLLYIKK